jgi:hypothetical protein
MRIAHHESVPADSGLFFPPDHKCDDNCHSDRYRNSDGQLDQVYFDVETFEDVVGHHLLVAMSGRGFFRLSFHGAAEEYPARRRNGSLF